MKGIKNLELLVGNETYLATNIEGKTAIFPVDKNLKQSGQSLRFAGKDIGKVEG